MSDEVEVSDREAARVFALLIGGALTAVSVLCFLAAIWAVKTETATNWSQTGLLTGIFGVVLLLVFAITATPPTADDTKETP